MCWKKYLQLLPPLLSLAAIVCVVGIFAVSFQSMAMSHDKILNSSTMAAISSESYHKTTLISLGILVPFMIDQVYVLLSGLKSPGYGSYLLLMLMIVIQVFNISIVCSNQSVDRFWGYHIGNCINSITICGVIYTLQINLVKHSIQTIYILSFSAALFNLSAVFRVLEFIFQLSINVYIWSAIVAVCIGCNLYIAHDWYTRCCTAKRTGLPHQEYCYAFILMIVLILYCSANLINLYASEAFDFESLTIDYVIIRHVILLCCFYSIIEIDALLKKHEAKSSVDALETKRAFVRYVSHEIRTPLNAATLGLQLLGQELHKMSSPKTDSNSCKSDEESFGLPRSQLVELVSDIAQACNIATEVLNDLLLYEKIDGGLMFLEKQEIEVGPYVEEVLKLFAVQAKVLNIDLILRNNIGNSTVFAIIDSYKISQVIRNLVSNALKFSVEDDKVIVSIELLESSSSEHSMSTSLYNYDYWHKASNLPITTTAADQKISNMELGHLNSASESSYGWFSTNASSALQKLKSHSNLQTPTPSNHQQIVRIKVQDFGAGISKENQERLFKEIVQFDAAKLQQGKGSGIGLWVSNRIMKLHSGNKIHVYSEGEGHGSEFFIDIPVSRAQQQSPHPLVSVKSSASLLDSLSYSLSTKTRTQPSSSFYLFSPKSPSQNIKKVVPFSSSNKSLDSYIIEELSVQDIPPSSDDTTDLMIPWTTKRNILNKSALYKVSEELDTSLDTTMSETFRSSRHLHGASNSSHHQEHNVSITSSAVEPFHKTETTTEVQLLPSKPHKRVLVIDDSKVNRKMLRMVLSKLFKECDEAVDGMDAIAKYRSRLDNDETVRDDQSVYNLIITDYMMPRMNGVDAVKELRAIGYTGPIIGLTGNTELDVVAAFEDAGVTKIFIKPLQGPELQEYLQQDKE